MKKQRRGFSAAMRVGLRVGRFLEKNKRQGPCIRCMSLAVSVKENGFIASLAKVRQKMGIWFTEGLQRTRIFMRFPG
ncbi:hypothetical protein [Caldibacillus debilis]|nr:hypothetical protein [Caldibacillus debilis]